MKLLAWLQAARLPSQSYIALPILLGQALWYQATGQIDIRALILAQLFGVFDQLYIVFANDYADIETDRNNQTSTMFSGGSRVLVDGKLSRRELLWAARIMASGTVVVSLIFAIVYGRWALLPLSGVAIALLWLYSFPPVRLSYRGGGELLQMLGVGVVLPLYGWFAQGGEFAPFPWVLMLVLVPTQWACGIATSIPDAPSDAVGEKRTVAVSFGTRGAGVILFIANVLGLGAFLSIAEPGVAAQVIAVPAVANVVALLLLRAEPGTTLMVVRTFFAVLVSIAALVGLNIWAFTA